jgi:hypothetical protein
MATLSLGTILLTRAEHIRHLGTSGRRSGSCNGIRGLEQGE